MIELNIFPLCVNILTLICLSIIFLKSCCINFAASHPSTNTNGSVPRCDITIILDFMLEYPII